MATKIQLRRDTAANWASNNPALSEGEVGYDTTNKALKVGDGTTTWDTLPTIQGGSVDLSAYATTAYVDGAVFSADYNDLTNTPTLFDGDYNSLANTPTLFDGDYDSLSNTPTLFDGDYDSLANKPTLFDGDYNSLTNTPTTSGFSGDYNDLTNKPDIGFGNKTLLDYNERIQNVGTVSGTLSVNPAFGTIMKLTASGDLTFQPSGFGPGQTLTLFIENTGTRTLSLSGAYFAGGNKEIDGYSIVSITYDGSKHWITVSKGYTT